MHDMRLRKPTNITLDPQIMAALDAWIEGQPFKIARSSVIETAIKEFLERQRGSAPQHRRGK